MVETSARAQPRRQDHVTISHALSIVFGQIGRVGLPAQSLAAQATQHGCDISKDILLMVGSSARVQSRKGNHATSRRALSIVFGQNGRPGLTAQQLAGQGRQPECDPLNTWLQMVEATAQAQLRRYIHAMRSHAALIVFGARGRVGLIARYRVVQATNLEGDQLKLWL